MSTLAFNTYGTPAPQGSKRGYVNRATGRVALVESSAKVRPWREAVKYAALDAMRTAGITCFDGPVEVHVTFGLAHPKYHYRSGAHAQQLRPNAPTWHAKKPDLDKLLRSTLDALTDAGLIRDDAQIASVHATKVYGPPGARITIRDSDDPT